MKWFIILSAAVMLSLTQLTSCKHSTEPPIQEPDTTSHNFVWEPPVLLGDGAGSGLYDVTIIDDTLAYAAGAVYGKDSSGTWDLNAYNLLKWNGMNWNPIRLQFYTICGQSGRTSYPASSVFAFGASDVWIAMDGSQIARWNGNVQTATMCLPVSFSIKKVWGGNANVIYAVGDGGNILRYDGSNWLKLSSGTTLDIRDVWGAAEPGTGRLQILAVASGNSPADGKKVLQINGTAASSVPDDGLSWSLYGIWFVPGQKYYVVGAGIGQKDVLDSSPWSVYPSGVVTSYLSGCVRGNGVNDVFVVGSFMECVHFNGKSWYNYKDQIPFADGALGRIAVKGNLAIAVGHVGQQAVAIVGRRK